MITWYYYIKKGSQNEQKFKIAIHNEVKNITFDPNSDLLLKITQVIYKEPKVILSITQEVSDGVKVFPNPSSNSIKLQYDWSLKIENIRIFNMKGDVLDQFFAYDKNFHGGVNIASGDINNDNFDEIITGAGSLGSPHVRIFKENGTLINSFFAFENEFEGGINVEVVMY